MSDIGIKYALMNFAGSELLVLTFANDVHGRLRKSPTTLVLQALDRALQRAGLSRGDLDGLIACPSLAEPRFMQVFPKRALHCANEFLTLKCFPFITCARRTISQLRPTY